MRWAALTAEQTRSKSACSFRGGRERLAYVFPPLPPHTVPDPARQSLNPPRTATSESCLEIPANATATQAPRRGFIKTGAEIVKRETPLGLYKGLGAVLTGIVPKMAIRFTSYEWYKQLLANKDGSVSGQSTFLGRWSLPYYNPRD